MGEDTKEALAKLDAKLAKVLEAYVSLMAEQKAMRKALGEVLEHVTPHEPSSEKYEHLKAWLLGLVAKNFVYTGNIVGKFGVSAHTALDWMKRFSETSEAKKKGWVLVEGHARFPARLTKGVHRKKD